MRLIRVMPAVSAFRRAMREAAPPETLGWMGTLVVIARHSQGARPSHVADVLMVDLSVVSRAINHLEELGFAVKKRDRSDGRAWIVYATEQGRQKLSEFAEGFSEHVSKKLDGWSDADVDTLAMQLRRFGASMRDDDTCPDCKAAADAQYFEVKA